jgi:hypothetical protein
MYVALLLTSKFHQNSVPLKINATLLVDVLEGGDDITSQNSGFCDKIKILKSSLF